jgi:hypothetical protein
MACAFSFFWSLFPYTPLTNGDNFPMPKLTPKLAALALLLTFALPAIPQQQLGATTAPWLFAGFKGNGEEGVYYALSLDGYHWTIANQDRPVFHQNQRNELMRDPFLQRGPDGTIHLVWTWSWNSPTVIGHATSTDFIHWSAHQQLNVLANEPAAINAWAPALYYDTAKKHWLIFWSSTIPGRFPGDNSGDNNLNHRIFSTTTTDFKTLTPAKLFFDPGYSVIDATILKTDSTYNLIFKDERKTPLKKVLQTATGPTLEGPWSNISPPISEPWSEGAAIIPVPGGYLAYYDHYVKPQHYRALFSPDLKTWTDATDRIAFPDKLRHGSFLQITPAEYESLNNLQQP